MAISQNPAATDAPDPLDEPPGVWKRLRGFRVSPGSDTANSAVTVFPANIAPAFNNFETQLAWDPLNNSEGSKEPHLVG